MRLDRLHRAYPSLHPFGVVHWVPVLSNIKTVTGVNRIDSCNFELCSQGQLCITINSLYSRMGWAAMSNNLPGCHLANAWRKSFETHPSVAVSQWSISSFIHSFIHRIYVLVWIYDSCIWGSGCLFMCMRVNSIAAMVLYATWRLELYFFKLLGDPKIMWSKYFM